MASGSDKLMMTLIFLLLLFTGLALIFNLLGGITPALDTSWAHKTSLIWWFIGKAVGITLVGLMSWLIYNVWTKL